MSITPAVLAARVNDEPGNALIAATPGGIEAQEAAGQKALCASSKIPQSMRRCSRQDFEALGFVFSDKPSDDSLFVNVTMPAGWKMQPTDHSMWNYIVDETGKKRFAIFYKAAFYDRRADIQPA